MPTIESEAAEVTTQTKDVPEAGDKEFDIKDLNVIDDKMARGTAKKAFLAAKRTGEDKVEAIRKALSESGKLDTAIEELLDSLSGDGIEVAKLIDTEKPATHLKMLQLNRHLNPIWQGICLCLKLLN